MVLRALLALTVACAAPAAAQQAAPPDGPGALVLRLEQAIASGNVPAALDLGETREAPGLGAFASAGAPAPTRFVIKERDRSTTDAGERLLLEVFRESGNESAISTWRLDTRASGPGGERRIAEMEQLSVVGGLHRLALNPARHFQVRDLTVRGTDLELVLPAGHAFVAETPQGPTAVVLLGRGRMRFSPSDPAERTQIRIFNGEDSLGAEFDAAFVRVHPSEFEHVFGAAAMTPRAVGRGELRRASEIFDEFIGQTLQLDLTDLSRDRWSLLPSPGDLIAEVRTRRLGALTYARSGRDAEDISLFDRRRRRNIAVYASPQKLASRGRFYSEDSLVEYDVRHYEIDAAIAPERPWIEGTAVLTLTVRSFILSSFTLRLAEPLVVRSIVSPELGRLLHLRVVGQNSVIVNLPTALPRDAELVLRVAYGGRLPPQAIEQEALAPEAQQGQMEVDQAVIMIEPQFVYSNRSYWYPQATVSDYATARLRLAVPSQFDVIASGTQAGSAEVIPGEAGARPVKTFRFDVERPVRYLSCLVSRFTTVQSRELALPTVHRVVTGSGGEVAGGAPADGAARGPAARAAEAQVPGIEAPALTLNILANPRQAGRARALADRAAAIIQFYAGIAGEAPYPAFTLAVTENELPGGHSPAYFAMLNHPPLMAVNVWRNDPVVFDSYGPFFLAHEIAHQWWGQGVGWKNYHEQWLSEGFAQYFAAMYAARDRGDEVMRSLLRQMRRWAVDRSDQGPVYLGYRLGHIKGESRVFRALVYNKGAMVLHMLRRLVGDTAFFDGLRQFYAEWRFKKAGTDDLRAVMERVSGRDLDRFFDGWIYGSSVPVLRFASRVSGTTATLTFEHVGEVVPVPVTVTITYSDGRTEELVVTVSERRVEEQVALNGTVRDIEPNRDHGAVAEFTR